MYTQSCTSANNTRIILTVIAILLVFLSAIHFANAGVNAHFINVAKNPYFYKIFGIADSIYQKEFVPTIAYHAIAGAIQVVINLIYLLMLWQIIKPTRIKLGVMVSLLILELGMVFAIGVWNSMKWTYYDGIWSEYLDLTAAQLQYLKSLNQLWGSFHSAVVSVYKVTIADSLVTLIVMLPAIIVKLFFFLNKTTSYAFLDKTEVYVEPNASDMRPPMTQTTINIAQ